MNRSDLIISRVLTISYPFILLFGFYIIVNGHLTPGGGFQGGAVLAAVFIIRYLVAEEKNINLKKIQLLEKVLFLGILLLPIGIIVFQLFKELPHIKTVYLISMNTLIGIKVCCGLMIVFYRFVLFESR